MRIVVSGTHASGKSTLVSDFALAHPGFAVLPDPYELMDEAGDSPHPAMFATQLRLSAIRLDPAQSPGDLIAERGPIDFLAYLLAMEDRAGVSASHEVVERAFAITREALRHVDLLVVLPLTAGDGIRAGDDEHLWLRDAMNEALLDLIDDPDVIGERTRVAEITGDRGQRLALLEALIAERAA